MARRGNRHAWRTRFVEREKKAQRLLDQPEITEVQLLLCAVEPVAIFRTIPESRIAIFATTLRNDQLPRIPAKADEESVTRASNYAAVNDYPQTSLRTPLNS
jgi:hypothetical protein